MACSANQEQVFSPLDQSGASNFGLVESKIKKNALCFDRLAFSNFALYVMRPKIKVCTVEPVLSGHPWEHGIETD